MGTMGLEIFLVTLSIRFLTSLIANNITITMDSMTDSKIWIYSNFENLTLKYVYSFKSTTFSTHHWSKQI